MDNRPNITSIKDYAERFAAVVCDDFYRKESAISGKQIMHFTAIKQVNLFVVKSVFERWQEETAKLQSPFFSYSEPEVKKALGSLMNTLSKSISIKREHIEPVLKQAIVDTLILTFSPTEYLYQLFKSHNKKISVQKEISPVLKYIKLHPNLIPKVFDRLYEEGFEIKRKNAISVFTEYILNHQNDIDDPFEIIYEFDQVLPIEVTKIAPKWKSLNKGNESKKEEAKFSVSDDLFDLENLEEELSISPKELATEKEEPTDIYNKENDLLNATKVSKEPNSNKNIDTEIENIKETSSLSAKEVKKNEVVDTKKKPLEELEEFDVSKVVSEALSDNIEEILEENKLPKIDHSKDVDKEVIEEVPPPKVRKAELPNMEELPKVEEKELRQPIHKNVEIEVEDPNKEPIKKKTTSLKRTKSLKEIIPKSHEGIFTKELFGGNQTTYLEAVNMIESAADYHSAVMQLRRKYVIDYDWDLTSDTTIDFLSMVDKSF